MFKAIAILLMMSVTTLLANTWKYHESKDEMSGETEYYASSPIVSATKKMDFPYSKTRAWIGVGCKKGEQWSYFGFTTSPNLNNTKTNSGHSSLSPRLKMGDEIVKLDLTQKWGNKFLHVSGYYSDVKYNLGDNSFIEKLKNNNSALLELDWHGNGSVYFKYPLQGSSKALSKLQKNCGYKPPAWASQNIDDYGKGKPKNEKVRTEKEFEKDCLDSRMFFVKVGSMYGCSEESDIGLTDKENCENIAGVYDDSNKICSKAIK